MAGGRDEQYPVLINCVIYKEDVDIKRIDIYPEDVEIEFVDGQKVKYYSQDEAMKRIQRTHRLVRRRNR